MSAEAYLAELETKAHQEIEHGSEVLAAVADIRLKLAGKAGNEGSGANSGPVPERRAEVTPMPPGMEQTPSREQFSASSSPRPAPALASESHVDQNPPFTAGQIAELPWVNYKNGGGSWVFSDLKEAAPVKAKIGTASFWKDEETGWFYYYSGEGKFLTRSKRAPK